VGPGLIALVATLAVALVAGVTWQRANGRMRGIGPAGGARGAPAAGAQSAGAQSAGAPAAGAQSAGTQAPGEPTADAGPVLTRTELGLPLGERATLVQFSTAFCTPCRATRRILGEVAGMIDGVAHVEIDAESHLDLVRRLDIRRTPTVLVVGPDGRIVKRASGQPRKADVMAAIDELA
jgi:thiol-disulfide isomerase/thioredoxin